METVKFGVDRFQCGTMLLKETESHTQDSQKFVMSKNSLIKLKGDDKLCKTNILVMKS